MQSLNDIELSERHRHELLREAAEERALAAATGTARRRPVYAPALAVLGGRLAALGLHLQREYGAGGPTASATAAHARHAESR